ncbi:unnamed protein product [Adineta steineri]|nr:unnamed protein product [Adineta steineri]
MVYFHSTHHQQLVSMQQQCKQAKNIGDLRHLASDIRSFCHTLHAHHTIEDQHMFPSIARKMDISHLEDHHKQLSQILIEFEICSKRLQQFTNTPNEDIKNVINDVTLLVNKVSTLVNEHERAEEQVIAPENMKKHFTENEMKQLFNI